MKKYLAISLQLLLGVMFLLSGFSKLPTLESFGWTIAETSWFGWVSSEWISRFIVGIELFIGVLFLAQLGIKKIARPIAIALLLVFSLYLIFVLNKYGNEANCGCYGEWIPLSTTQSLWKNAILFVLLLINIFCAFDVHVRFKKWILVGIFLAGILTPFIYWPPDSIYIQEKEELLKEKFPRDILTKFSNDSTPNTSKIIVAIVSPGCKYCRKAASRMRIMKERHPQLPFLFVFGGTGAGLDDFFEGTKAKNIPFIVIDNADEFYELNGRKAVPTIKWIENGTCIKYSNYYNLNEVDILDWLSD